jgi:hypothetical protein
VEENRKKVTKALKKKKVDLVCTTKWPFLGTFLRFLDETGVAKAMDNLTGSHKRKNVLPKLCALVYIIKLIIGIPRIRGSEVLLGDEAAMKLAGFPEHKIQNGLCARGDANQYGEGYKKNPLRHELLYIN